jgi:twinkle protein
MLTALQPIHAKFLESRKIDPETAIRYGVCSATRSDIGEAVAFSFIEHGKTVNHKYRGRGKAFRQDKDAIKCFWNHDAILDPALRDGTQRLIITEGEMDALSAIESGFPLTVSVPDGAPATAKDDPVDPESDLKFSFVHRAWDSLKMVKQIIIAVDDDPAGKALAAELVRRLSPARCLFVTYPDGCKDLNEVLMQHGAAGVARVINGAKLWPVKGLYRLSDYPDMGDLTVFDTGWPMMDRWLKLYLGEFMVVTGIPNHGKSAWLNALAMNMAKRHGWNIGMGSFETRIKPFLRAQLRAYHGGDWWDADAFVEKHFSFLGLQPTDDTDDADLEWMLDRAADAVTRHGMNMLILDPWNEIEHKRNKSETETEYISRAIRMMKRFATNFNCVVAIVAHPQKMNVGKENTIKEPTLYDISGSANWYNKADHGIVVHRPKPGAPLASVSTRKVRFQPETGRPGTQGFFYNLVSKRFEEMPDELGQQN